MKRSDRSSVHGIALVAALLVLAATSAVAAGTFLLLGIETALVRNRQELTLARAEAQTRLVSALLTVESQAQSAGRLPDTPPEVEGVSEYRRIDELRGIVEVVAEVGSARVESGARIVLMEGGEGWRVHVPDRR